METWNGTMAKLDEQNKKKETKLIIATQTKNPRSNRKKLHIYGLFFKQYEGQEKGDS